MRRVFLLILIDIHSPIITHSSVCWEIITSLVWWALLLYNFLTVCVIVVCVIVILTVCVIVTNICMIVTYICAIAQFTAHKASMLQPKGGLQKKGPFS